MDSRARAWLGQAFEHKADHREADEGGDCRSVSFEIAGQTAIAADPGECSFNDPSFWQHHETMQIGTFDDLDFPAPGCSHDVRHFWPLISCIGEYALDEWKPATRFVQQGASAVPILNIGGQNAHAEEKAERVDKDMALAARDFLARVKALRIERGAPF
jgi:hypothetical protein